MLALFLNHSPLFVAGEIALGLAGLVRREGAATRSMVRAASQEQRGQLARQQL